MGELERSALAEARSRELQARRDLIKKLRTERRAQRQQEAAKPENKARKLMREAHRREAREARRREMARSRQSQAMRDELKNKIQALAESERSADPETQQAMLDMIIKLNNIERPERQHAERVRKQREEAAKRRAVQQQVEADKRRADQQQVEADKRRAVQQQVEADKRRVVQEERDFGETPVDSNFRPVEADSLQKKITLAESERSAHEATLYTYRPGEARSRQSQAMRDELKNKIQALAESERSADPETRQAMREMLKKLHTMC